MDPVVQSTAPAAAAELRIVDPADPVVQQCWLEYFATIAERFDTGYDPEQSRHAGPQARIARAGPIEKLRPLRGRLDFQRLQKDGFLGE